MYSKHYFLIVAICFSGLLFGQDSVLLKRTPYKLKVAVDKKTFYEEDLNAAPYVLQNNIIQLYPGEKLYIEIEQVNGEIKSMKAVKEIIDSTKTITLHFTQTVQKKVHQMMMLEITNPFKQQLLYKASIFLLKYSKWVKTTVYPVQPELSSFETWPDIITSIGLGEWSFKNN